MEKERWTLEYIDHVKQVQRGKATKERNKKQLSLSLSLSWRDPSQPTESIKGIEPTFMHIQT